MRSLFFLIYRHLLSEDKLSMKTKECARQKELEKIFTFRLHVASNPCGQGVFHDSAQQIDNDVPTRDLSECCPVTAFTPKSHVNETEHIAAWCLPLGSLMDLTTRKTSEVYGWLFCSRRNMCESCLNCFNYVKLFWIRKQIESLKAKFVHCSLKLVPVYFRGSTNSGRKKPLLVGSLIDISTVNIQRLSTAVNRWTVKLVIQNGVTNRGQKRQGIK